MNTLRNLVDRCADQKGVAIGTPETGDQVYTYDRLAETTYSLARVLSDRDINEDSLVAIAPTGGPETVVGLLGAAIVGARVRFSGPAKAPVDALFAPADIIDRYQVPADAVRIGFGSRPENDQTLYFGRTVWKADPNPPEAPVLPTTTALTDGEYAYSHRAMIRAARKAIDARDMDQEMTIVLRAPLTDPRAVAGGIVAPLIAGGTLRFPTNKRSHGDLAIAADDAPEDRLLLLFDIPLR